MLDIDIKKLFIANIAVAVILLIHLAITLSSLSILRNKQGPTGDEGPKGETGNSGMCYEKPG